MRVLYRNQWQDMGLNAGPSLPWNLFLIDTQKFESITRNQVHEAENLQMRSMVLCSFSGNADCRLGANCIYTGEGGAVEAPTWAAAMCLTRASSLTMQVTRPCFNRDLCFGQRQCLTHWMSSFSSYILWLSKIGSHKIVDKVYFLFKTWIIWNIS